LSDETATSERQPSDDLQVQEPAMEIHKVKPIHTWHDFFKELGTIVLGICIALGGEAVLEWNHWRNQVQEARAVIASEMTYNLIGAIARMRAADCVDRRLDALSKILDEAARTGSLPPVGAVGSPPRHQWRSGAWESVVASQAASHFSPEQLAALSSLYKSVQRADLLSTREMEAWSDINTMVGPGRRLDSTSEADLRKALGFARDTSGLVAADSAFVVIAAAGINLPFTLAERKELARIKKRPLTGPVPQWDQTNASTSAICGPVGTVPAGYSGQARNFVPRSEEAAKALGEVGQVAP
jgi:hypothetical protein